MAYTLYDLVIRVARELETLKEGTATGGSTTTVIDTVYLANRYEDDHFNAGQAFILYDAGGASAAPEGEWARITDFVKSTGVVTCGTLTAAVAAGDRYAVMDDRFTLDEIIQGINRVLGETPIEVTDITTMDTAADQLEYNLPTGMLDRNIQVWLQQDTNDADANQWTLITDWYIQETSTGTAKLLVFWQQPAYPYALKVVYRIYHPALYARTDKLREDIDIIKIAYLAAYRCLLNKFAERGVADPLMERRLQEMGARAEMMRARHPNRINEIKLNNI